MEDINHKSDPTANVLQLVSTAVTRLEDLRQAEVFRVNDKIDAEVRRTNEVMIAKFTEMHNLFESEKLRSNDWRDAESKRLDERMAIASNYTSQLADAEAKRIDAIRAVDVAAVATANEKATVQATVLASQVSSSAETLRALVAQTAATVATQLNQVSSGIADRLSALEKSSYEGIGKGRVIDPQLDSLLSEVKHLRDAQTSGQGRASGMSSSWGLLVGAVLLISAIMGMFFLYIYPLLYCLKIMV